MSDVTEGPYSQLRTRVLEALAVDLRLAARDSAWATDLKILRRLLGSNPSECSMKVLLVIAKGRGLL